MSYKLTNSTKAKAQTPFKKKPLHLVKIPTEGNLLELLHPGSFVTLENHPKDLPPFQVINCKGGRCWVRQQSWGKFVHWEVEHQRLRSA